MIARIASAIAFADPVPARPHTTRRYPIIPVS
jgi:hypothetical protein